VNTGTPQSSQVSLIHDNGAHGCSHNQHFMATDNKICRHYFHTQEMKHSVINKAIDQCTVS